MRINLLNGKKYYAEKYKGSFGEIAAVHFIKILDSEPTVDAVPIEWIEKHISKIENDVPNVAGAFKGLIVIWRAEQESGNETD